MRRLHFVGSCGKVPGEHYRNFETWGSVMPPESELDCVCSICFRGGLVRPQEVADTVEDMESSSSSDSSSSSSSEPSGKKRKSA